MMSKSHSGFTIIEVVLFFAVSAALMLGIVSGVSQSISRQRYNDTINDVAEYVRSTYNEVQSVANGKFFENTTDSIAGRSDQAIYGKLLVFGANGGNQIRSYTITGKAINSSFTTVSTLKHADDTSCSDNDTILQLLDCVGATVDVETESTYSLVWSGALEETNSGEAKSASALIVRSPVSGAIHTYVKNTADTNLVDFDNATNLDFCIDSEDNPHKVRRNLRIKADASTSSGVDLPPLNSTYDATSNPDGSVCESGVGSPGIVPTS